MTKKQKGIIFIIISAFLFALMNLFVKLSGGLPPIQKAFFRNAGAFIISSFVILKHRKAIHIKKEALPLLISRAVFGTIGIVCNFYALTELQLSDASTLSKLAPFFVVIFSFLFLKENIKPYQAIAIIVAFLASLLIVKPSFSSNNYTLYAIIATCGAMGATRWIVVGLPYSNSAGQFSTLRGITLVIASPNLNVAFISFVVTFLCLLSNSQV